MENKHHLNGPSSLERRALCPGSGSLEKDLPEETSDDSNEGTMLHGFVAKRSVSPESTAEQRELVERCINIADKYSEGALEVFYELKMRLIGDDFQEIIFGTADFVAVFEDSVTVIDWKFGHLPVELPRENAQLAALAAMAMQKFGKKECKTFIYQPRLNWRGKELPGYKFAHEDAIIAKIQSIIAECEKENPKLVPGEIQCRYCKAKALCPALVENAKAEVAKLEELTPEKNYSASVLTIEDAIDIYKNFGEKFKLIAKFKDSLENKIKLYLKQNNNEALGLKLNIRNGNRKINDPAMAYVLLQDDLTQDEFLSFCNITTGKLEDCYARKIQDKAKESGEKMTLTKAKEKFNLILEPVLENGSPVETISINP